MFPSDIDKKKISHSSLKTHPREAGGTKFNTYSHTLSYDGGKLLVCPGRMKLVEKLVLYNLPDYKYQGVLSTDTKSKSGKELLHLSKLLRETCISHVEAEGRKGEFVPRSNHKTGGTETIEDMLKSIFISPLRRIPIKEEELSALKIGVVMYDDVKFKKSNGSSIPTEEILKMKDIELAPTLHVREVHYASHHAVHIFFLTEATVFPIGEEDNETSSGKEPTGKVVVVKEEGEIQIDDK